MSDIFLFSGTSEGRELSEFLTANRIKHDVFVATEYGEIVMEKSDYALIHRGRLNLQEMKELMKSENVRLVIDATHPYAVDVTANLKQAVEGDMEYLRVMRRLVRTSDLKGEDLPTYKVVSSTEEAIAYLETREGKILLTTGVKTLPAYSATSLKERLVARILPSRESLEMAYEAGLEPKQILAMEGPFSCEMNEAILREYDVRILVTKNSGERGGFLEKLRACRSLGVEALIIESKESGEGLSLKQAEQKILSMFDKIYICGVGVCNEKSLTVAARDAIAGASVLIGARRMISFGQTLNPDAECIESYNPDEILSIVQKREGIVILVSGDTGFYSGATKTYELLTEAGFEVELLPAVSSISYFASQLGEAYSDAALLSNHGREEDVIAELLRKGRIYTLVSGPEDVNAIIEKIRIFDDRTLVSVGYNLGGLDEEVYSFLAGEPRVASFDRKGLYVLSAKRMEEKIEEADRG